MSNDRAGESVSKGNCEDEVCALDDAGGVPPAALGEIDSRDAEAINAFANSIKTFWAPLPNGSSVELPVMPEII